MVQFHSPPFYFIGGTNMVMDSQNFKVGSAKWLRDRNRAIVDKSGFTTAELSYLDITGNMGQGNDDNDRYLIDTQHVDKNTEQRKNAIDIRDRPEAGGGD